MPDNPTRFVVSDVARALLWGFAAAAGILLAIVAGSRGLRDFNPALVPYAGAAVLAAFGLGYRYAMWLRRPPTALYWRRSWAIALQKGARRRNLRWLARLIWDDLVAQRFIGRRSRARQTAHWLIAWGCVLAAAVAFPISFGWIRFETAPDSQAMYRAFVFGLHVLSFRLDGWLAPLVFHALDLAAVMVLAGLALAVWRRGRDRGALAGQQFANDLVPLALLFAVCVTGLFLTASIYLLGGLQYTVLSQIHAAAVILTLLYLPFGKFFHVFQRPAQLGVAFYKRAAEGDTRPRCERCGEPFAGRLHVEDLKQVEAALGIRYQLDDGGHYQEVCPACRRKALALSQEALWRVAARGPAGRGPRG